MLGLTLGYLIPLVMHGEDHAFGPGFMLLSYGTHVLANETTLIGNIGF
jgi:hypothetical protein